MSSGLLCQWPPGHQDRGISQPAREARPLGLGWVAVLQGTRPGIVHTSSARRTMAAGGTHTGRELEQTYESPQEGTLGCGGHEGELAERRRLVLTSPLARGHVCAERSVSSAAQR